MKVQRRFGIAAGIAVASLAMLAAPASAATWEKSSVLQGNYQAYTVSGATMMTWNTTTKRMSAAEIGGDTSGSMGLQVCAGGCSSWSWHSTGIYDKYGLHSEYTIEGYYLGHY